MLDTSKPIEEMDREELMEWAKLLKLVIDHRSGRVPEGAFQKPLFENNDSAYHGGLVPSRYVPFLFLNLDI